MTKIDHILSEVADVLETVSGLSVYNNTKSNAEPERPFATIYHVGSQKREQSLEGVSHEVTETMVVRVNVEATQSATVLQERNRIAAAIEHACAVYTLAAYTDAQFQLQKASLTFVGASGMLDKDEDKGAFVVTINATYWQTIILE